ncbi:MAG TPA: hypothetical protein VHH34_00665 [Pseudonocardiaceae bacterium]|nr:hypothetical protein [Pseudonocardiaceae bacterium]
MATHHRLVGDMVCCCGWEDSPQAFHWSRDLPAVGFGSRRFSDHHRRTEGEPRKDEPSTAAQSRGVAAAAP